MAGDHEASGYGPMMRFVVMSLQDLNLGVIPNVKTESMPILGNFTVELPEHCVDVLKVGKMNGSVIQVFGEDKNIRRNVSEARCTCPNDVDVEAGTAVCPACTFHGFYSGGEYGELYGMRMPQFQNGKFRYNRELNRLEFGSGYDVYEGSHVVVEYRSALMPGDAQMIPVEAQQVILQRTLAFAHMNVPGKANFHLQQFRMEYERLKSLYNRMTIYDWVAAIRGERVQSPRA